MIPKLSILFFSSNQNLDLVARMAAQADRSGFEALWFPERHGHEFGGLHPNPSLMAAAAARCTSQIRLRAGSVILPLHSPWRVAEEWALVDRLSDGRVGLGFTSGWCRDDFRLLNAEHRFETRADFARAAAQEVAWHWRNRNLHPQPVQAELPLWDTVAHRPRRFRAAGRAGYNVLTALLFQPLECLESNIRVYRESRPDPPERAQASREGPGQARRGQVTLAAHAAPGWCSSDGPLRESFQRYMLSSVDLWKAAEPRLALAAERKPELLSQLAMDRYLDEAGLFGSSARVREKLEEFYELGVDEVACIMDFGLPSDEVLRNVTRLRDIQNTAREA